MHRRDLLCGLTASTLGVTFAGGLNFADDLSATTSSEPRPGTSGALTGPARRVIYLFMEGAMSHLETFDPKTDGSAAGPGRPIATSVAGVHFSSYLPNLADRADQVAIVRSLSTTTGDHAGGQYMMRTAYTRANAAAHPAMGAYVVQSLGRDNPHLPGNYVIGSAAGHPGAGFLDATLSPVPIGKPDGGLANSNLPRYVTPPLLDRRLSLASRLDRDFQARYGDDTGVAAYNRLYREARQLVGSEHLTAFDLQKEPADLRSRYGEDSFGQGCLLARRLCQHGARFVEVTLGGWDMHQELDEQMSERSAILDRALSALLDDLTASGLIGETLVVLTTEFGRKPDMNSNEGRDHHPGAFSSLLAGAGVAAGTVYGATDARGQEVTDSHASIADFNRTIAAAAGLPLDQDVIAPNGRPFKIGGDGTPITELLTGDFS